MHGYKPISFNGQCSYVPWPVSALGERYGKYEAGKNEIGRETHEQDSFCQIRMSQKHGLSILYYKQAHSCRGHWDNAPQMKKPT